ncbi:MAG: glycosyltransferase family 2 protein [bacterium]
MTHPIAVVFALPWIILPLVALARVRHSRSLDEYPAQANADAPLVSVVIPARNEVHNIERCVRSVLASSHPALEVIAVDDHSADGTSEILARLARDDDRVRIVVPDALPPDWFGKQWACAAGFRVSRGEVVAFFDADTWQASDLLPRAMRALDDRAADLLTIAGRQAYGSFWERLVQPQVFGIMLARYGGTESVNDSTRVADKIANGQCIFMRRGAYEEVGGHGAVRGKVAEDLALAQLFFTRDKRTVAILGLDQLSTRMYTSLGELVEGWGKNMYAGGIDAMPAGPFWRLLYPVALVSPALLGVVPPVLVALSFMGVVNAGLLQWAEIVSVANLFWWFAVYMVFGASPLYALLYPLGASVLLYITGRSVVRGRHVEWKGRTYVAG